MPSFQSSVIGEKRKQPEDQASRKRLALESPNGRSAAEYANGSFKEEYWMIQWYVHLQYHRDQWYTPA